MKRFGSIIILSHSLATTIFTGPSFDCEGTCDFKNGGHVPLRIEFRNSRKLGTLISLSSGKGHRIFYSMILIKMKRKKNGYKRTCFVSSTAMQGTFVPLKPNTGALCLYNSLEKKKCKFRMKQFISFLKPFQMSNIELKFEFLS